MRELFATDDYAHLFREARGDDIVYRFELGDVLPPAHVIGNVSIVPHVGDDWLLLRLVGGPWDVPGGTLEPGEDILDTLRRELLEEAGARLVDFHPFGFWRCHSTASVPYRPHVPHPDSCRVVGHGEVVLVGEPLNPPGAEQVVEVVCTSLEGACARFLSVGRGDLADLYRLAARARDLTGGDKTAEAVTTNRDRGCEGGE